MSSLWETHRWFRIALSALAVPLGGSVAWLAGRWALYAMGSILALPDTGGHGLEFLIGILLGAATCLLGGVTATVNTWALAVTNLFGLPIGELSSRAQKVTRMAYLTAAITTLLVIAAGMSLVFNLFLMRAVLPWLLTK